MEPHDPTNEYLKSLFTDIEKTQNQVLQNFELKDVDYTHDLVWISIGEYVLPVSLKQIDRPKETLFVYQNKYEIEKIPYIYIQGLRIPLSCKQMIELPPKYSKPYKKYVENSF